MRHLTTYTPVMHHRSSLSRNPGAEGVTVKRVLMRDRQLTCVPDNTARNHLAFSIDLHDKALQDVPVGRVVWWANGEV